jgi:hypothetical protein
MRDAARTTSTASSMVVVGGRSVGLQNGGEVEADLHDARSRRGTLAQEDRDVARTRRGSAVTCAGPRGTRADDFYSWIWILPPIKTPDAE